LLLDFLLERREEWLVGLLSLPRRRLIFCGPRSFTGKKGGREEKNNRSGRSAAFNDFSSRGGRGRGKRGEKGRGLFPVLLLGLGRRGTCTREVLLVFNP